MGWKKLKEVFGMAGVVLRTDILEDRDGKSRGMGTVTFEMPIEAVQAVCILCHIQCTSFLFLQLGFLAFCVYFLNYPSAMFNGQLLFNRTMHVKLVCHKTLIVKSILLQRWTSF